MHFLVNNWIFSKFMLLSGLVMIFTNLFISYGCTKDPYAWSKLDNILFFSLTRPTYSLGWLLVVFYVILGHTSLGRMILANPGFNAAGKLIYPAYLISPIVMMIVYSSTDHGIMMSMSVNITLGMGHMVLAFGVGFFIYLLLQWPMTCSIRIFLHPIFAHEDLLRVHSTKMNELKMDF